MALEISLKEICSNLTSIRVSERKKNAEMLKDMLSRTAVPSLLNENTLRKSGYTWNHVFSDINEYILKETEKFETNKNFATVVGIASSLLNLSVSNSNKGQAYIKCDIIMEACFNVFNDNRLRKSVGDIYISVLHKHVISNNYFIGYITPSMWENLLEVSITTCLSNVSELDNLTKLKFLLLVIKNISCSVQCSVWLRDSLSDLIKCVQKEMHDKKIQELAMKIILLIIELLAAESRLYICGFIEKVLPLLLKIYDHNMDVKKKNLLFKLLKLAVLIHHPMGRLSNEEGSAAQDWDSWNKNVQSILEIVCLEINYIQRNIKQSNMYHNIVDNFSSLAAITYYQVFNVCKSDDIVELVEIGNSAKKQKTSFNNSKTFDDLLHEFQQNPETWVGIILMYMKNFKHSLNPSHYLSLLRISEPLVHTTSKSFNWSEFGGIICLVVDYYSVNQKVAEENSDILVSLFNTCVRNSAISNGAHSSIHLILKSLLRLPVLTYTHIQPLLVFYFEKGMPVNNDTLKTFSFVYFKFFTNCSNIDQRTKCLNWLSRVRMIDIDPHILEEIYFQLMSNDSILSKTCDYIDTYADNVYNNLFDNIERSLLFEQFELESDYSTTKKLELDSRKNVEDVDVIEINYEMRDLVLNYLHISLTDLPRTISNKDGSAVTVSKHVHVILLLYKSFLKYRIFTKEYILSTQLYITVIEALKNVFAFLTRLLRSDEQPQEKIALLKYLKNILETNYESFIDVAIRSCINEDCFHSINEVLKAEVDREDSEINSEDDVECTLDGVRHNCVLLVAAFCSHPHYYNDELVKCMLDEDVYNFDSQWDIECAFQCIRTVIDNDRSNKYLGSVFSLLQSMCRTLFRNSHASMGLLRILLSILEKVWSTNDKVIRQNCIIMVKSYLQRCMKMYYPPRVAVLAYECAARVVELNYKQDTELDDYLKESVLEQLKGGTHSIRVYCCYLMRYLNIDATDINSIADLLKDIFVINIMNNHEIMLKDETVNRTMTVLHCFFAISQVKPHLVHEIMSRIILIQKKKSLNIRVCRKVMNVIIKSVTDLTLDDYINKNILRFLYFWSHEKEAFESIPFNLLGFKGIDNFIENHLKCLVASDILWSNRGHIESSDITKYIVLKSGKSLEDVIEMSFCSIISLCLPQIVIEKYKLEDEKRRDFNLKLEDSNRMFQLTRKILKNEKWSNLFVEHMGELILLAAKNICDPLNAESEFQVNLHSKHHPFMYSKAVFEAILKYFGELIDGDIMQYICENQPLVILNILFKLWANFLKEKVVDFKISNLFTYICFIETVPLGFKSDEVLCNFAWRSLANALTSQSSDGVSHKVLVHSLRVIVEKVLKHPSDSLNSTKKAMISKVLSILSVKKDEGMGDANNLVTYLLDYNNKSDDEVDYIDILSHESGTFECTTELQFNEILKKYITNLTFPSYEVLGNLKLFLKQNKSHVDDLIRNLNIKGFSEECSHSRIHLLLNALNNIIKTSGDNKITIEACYCLNEICTYDIKTLVTVPPADTKMVVTLTPTQYFAFNILSTLSNELFDDDPTVSTKVAKAINRLLKFRDCVLALDMEGINKKILQPLAPATSDIFSIYKLDDIKFELYKCSDYWIPKPNEEHSMWIVRITTALLDMLASSHNALAAVSAVCVVKPSICSKVMPAVVGLLLDSKSEKLFRMLSEQINQFFTYIWDMSLEDKIESTDDGSSEVPITLDSNHQKIIEYVIDAVDFVRLQAIHYKLGGAGPAERLNPLHAAYGRVAGAARSAGRALVALQYGELAAAAAAAANGAAPPAAPHLLAALPDGAHLQAIFRACFVSIGEIDAIEGCGTAHLTSEIEKRKHLISTGQYLDALLLHDIALSDGEGGGGAEAGLRRGAALALRRAGLVHLALHYARSCPPDDRLDDVTYDCLASLGDWSAVVDTRSLHAKSKLPACNINSITNMYRYACLKDCLNVEPNEEFFTRLQRPLNEAKLALTKLCRTLNMENSLCVYKVMAKFQVFQDIERYFAIRCGKENVLKLIDDWKLEKLPPYKDFGHIEGVISQRSLMLQHAAENNGIHSEIINSLHLEYAELALLNERVQIAQRIVAMVKKICPTKEVTLLESKVAWEKGHKDIALSLLQSNVTDESDNAKLTAMSLRQYGIWMAECKRENARDIIDKYLEKSLNVLKDNDDVDTRLKVYYDIATFADAEYKQVVSYMNSTIFENKVKCLESLKGTAASLKSSQQTLTRDEKKALIANNAFRQLDEADIAHTRAERDSFLNLAMRYYLLSLKQSDENNLSVFRVISLWFENSDIDLNNEETGRLGEILQSIPSWKFITVLPQIAPRLTTDNTPFAQHLRNLIKRCAIEHPHHTLPILFNLKNSDKDEGLRASQTGMTSRGGGVTSHKGVTSREPHPRTTAARALIGRLAERPKLRPVVEQMDSMCEAIIRFAYFVPTSKEIGKPLAIPTGEQIAKLRGLDSIPVPTDTITIRRDCDYSSLSTLLWFEDHYQLVGGINSPKKISCRGSDGRKRILLIKGEDDLRQDAVMQQVFNIVNELLEKNPVTYHNRLLIRTYKVVALSRRSGVLQWCEGTAPLGAYLMRAHTHYRPQDITPSEARQRLIKCHENRKSNKQKLEVFNEILRVFKPVFHYFFTEHYLDAVTWYERRLAYTRSVATSSMVGYIMGIGDRHVQNILIDKTTAEVIHIDFGIAFDQGQTLPTPETVPFRLTQDIIAGFGSSGVEGIFRRCCEKTLQLLRDNQETLLTILEVLLCDPLYLWIVPNAAQNATAGERRGGGGASGGLAQRALLGVRGKLCGSERGAAAVSVRGQAAALLARATDRTNLCRLFHGWQPYL